MTEAEFKLTGSLTSKVGRSQLLIVALSGITSEIRGSDSLKSNEAEGLSSRKSKVLEGMAA